MTNTEERKAYENAISQAREAYNEATAQALYDALGKVTPDS